MQTDFVQRWRVRVPRYRPARECIDASAYDVVELRHDGETKAFVETNHYSGTYPAARFRFGLTRGSHLVGVAVFSHPCNDAVLTSVFGGEAIESVELGRFVLLDDVPGNGETWFLARCIDVLRKRELRGVVAFSDPHPRHDVHGRVVISASSTRRTTGTTSGGAPGARCTSCQTVLCSPRGLPRRCDGGRWAGSTPSSSSSRLVHRRRRRRGTCDRGCRRPSVACVDSSTPATIATRGACTGQ